MHSHTLILLPLLPPSPSPVQDFEQTLALVSEYQFPSLFINQFYPRPGTPAARMKRIPTQEVAWLSLSLVASCRGAFHAHKFVLQK